MIENLFSLLVVSEWAHDPQVVTPVMILALEVIQCFSTLQSTEESSDDTPNSLNIKI